MFTHSAKVASPLALSLHARQLLGPSRRDARRAASRQGLAVSGRHRGCLFRRGLCRRGRGLALRFHCQGDSSAWFTQYERDCVVIDAKLRLQARGWSAGSPRAGTHPCVRVSVRASCCRLPPSLPLSPSVSLCREPSRTAHHPPPACKLRLQTSKGSLASLDPPPPGGTVQKEGGRGGDEGTQVRTALGGHQVSPGRRCARRSLLSEHRTWNKGPKQRRTH